MHKFGKALLGLRESGNLDGVMALLADDVVFRSPVVYAPYHGRAEVAPLLRAVGQVLDDFHFVRHIGDADGADHALVFRARIGDRELEGCDFVHHNADGLVDEFYVMVRPLSGAMALADAMKKQLSVNTTGTAR